MKILRVNELMCPCCGRGMDSGYPYPACPQTERHGMTQDEAHSVFCHGFAREVCAKCAERGVL